MFKKINLKLILYFIIAIGISYILIYLITPQDFFKSPMYMLLPIVGFFGMYYISDYVRGYMKITNKYYFTLIFLLVGVFSYYLAIFFFYWNISILNNIPIKEIVKFIFSNQNLFFKSAFLGFLISGAIGSIVK